MFISVFILCGGPSDVISMKSKMKGPITEETVFILLDVYKWAACTFFCLTFGIRTWNAVWRRLDRLSLQPQLLRQRNVQPRHAGCPCGHSATEELHQRVTLDFKWHGELRAIVPVWLLGLLSDCLSIGRSMTMWLDTTTGLCSSGKWWESGSSVRKIRGKPSTCLWVTTRLEMPHSMVHMMIGKKNAYNEIF